MPAQKHTPNLLAYENAIQRARSFEGATAPNPPVGAVAVDALGKVLSVQAHERAGTGHAEAKVLSDLRERSLLGQVHELFITLEPCNHHGRTPPCTEAILAANVRRVVYGTHDPNPRVAGQGAERLRAAGVDVQECSDPALREQCQALIQPFSHWARTGLPWVVVKTAHRAGTSGTTPQSMIPPQGQKTFTSQDSLRLAHELRRRADAILTGSGTVLADRPKLNVRHVADHDLIRNGPKPRKLVVLDRRCRVPNDWIAQERALGFEVWIRMDFEETLEELGKAGVLELLVEAGPELSSALLRGSLWNRHVLITRGNPDITPDTIQDRINVHWHYSKSRPGYSCETFDKF